MTKSSKPPVRVERRGRIFLLTIDNPPVNALSQPVRAAIIAAIDAVNESDESDALVLACAGGTFIAGADIREFDGPPREPHLPDVIEAIDASAKPVIAALHGTALGGGLEVALACRYRVAAPDTKLGFPEVKLGLLPGARGTQHLPRLLGVEKALEMIAFGSPIAAAEASEIGLVDAIVADDLVERALAFAATVIGKQRPSMRDRPIPIADAAVFERFEQTNARKLRGLDAPRAIVRAVRASTELPYAEAGALERELFLQLRSGQQSKALRHVFQAERATAKLPELAGVTPRPIERVGIIGAGTMGAGIAISFLLADMPVTLVDQAPEALTRGIATITRTLGANVASGRTDRAHAERARSNLSESLDMGDLSTVDLLIEAAFETIEVKRSIFSRLRDIARPGAILASNTSYLDLDAIAEAGGRAVDTVGLHFFSPANVMKLLEIVRGRETAPDVLAAAFALAKRIGKIPVLSTNAYGFIGNRMLAVRRREAEAMIVEGASPYAVDRVMEAFGFPMGPFRMGDLAGLDLGWSADVSAGATVRERLCEAGRRGQKTGAGFYDYDEMRRPTPSPDVEALITRFAEDTGVAQRMFDDSEILDRLLWPMIDEGARVLDEGVARSADDVDVVWINGYGWPAWTGGPMFHAASVGWARIADTLRSMGRTPSPALARAAGSGTLSSNGRT